MTADQSPSPLRATALELRRLMASLADDACPVAVLQRAMPLLDDLVDAIDEAERYVAYLRRAQPHDLRGIPGGQVTIRPEGKLADLFELDWDVASRWEC